MPCNPLVVPSHFLSVLLTRTAVDWRGVVSLLLAHPGDSAIPSAFLAHAAHPLALRLVSTCNHAPRAVMPPGSAHRLPSVQVTAPPSSSSAPTPS